MVDFVDANDVPGVNDWRHNRKIPEEIFSSGKIHYAGQSVGLIVAETREIALEAARKVVIEYVNKGSIVVDMEKAMEDPANISVASDTTEYGPVDSNMESAARIVEGRFKMGSQYHFHLETHNCIVTPVEDGFNLTIPTQSANDTQEVVAKALNVPINR